MEEIKLNGESKDITQDNIDKLKELFPEIVTEGMIDFDKLKVILGENIDGSDERYNFTWPEKNKIIQKSQKPSKCTLIPSKEDSKNWDITQNLYIEGDNFEVLKLLQKSYYNKVSAIYIDPPYNTGNNILYLNDYSENPLEYLKITGKIVEDDETGKQFKVSTNSETDGRYHTNWLNIIYPVLRLGKNLLSDNGLIFIAIDDYEYARLKMISDEIFGEPNFLGTVVTKCNPQGRGKKNLDPVHEYHLIYAKDIDSMVELRLKKKSDVLEYQNFMRSGTNSRKYERPYRFYPMLVKDNKVSVISPEEYKKIYNGNSFDEEFLNHLDEKYSSLGYEVIFPIAKNGEEKVWQRTYQRAHDECSTYVFQNGKIKTPKDNYRTPITLWTDVEYSNVSNGTNELKKLLNTDKTFDMYPKSIFTVEDLISLAPEGIILDFFSGSGTTAHSVFKYNDENDKNNRFILVQIPALCDEDSDAYKEGYRNICELAEKRIKSAGEKVISESGNKELDIGFKVFKLASSNLTKWNPNVDNLEDSLVSAADNIVEGRTSLDLVYEIMLKYGLELTLPVEEISKDIFSVAFGSLVICLRENVDENVIQEIFKLINGSAVSRVVFKDNGFKTDSDKTNIKENLRVNGVDEFITI